MNLCTAEQVDEAILADLPQQPRPAQEPLFCWLFGCQLHDEHQHGIWIAP